MDNKPILFIDSGIGGLLYCRDFLKHNPREEVCYLADTKNFPYGQREKEELISILITLIEKLLKTIYPKIIVIACNTATISALDPLREHFPDISFVGTVPAIKPAAKASIKRKVGVLGTTRTVEDPYNQSLVKDSCEILAVAAPELVEFVEQRFEKADENEKTEIVKKYIDIFRKEGIDTLVLGCTHYLYLLDEFRKEASPDIQIFDSLDGITKRIEFLLDENNGKLRADIDFEPVHWLFLTGTDPQGSVWQERCQELGFALCILDSI
ncbi:MAG: glutamate racemase [Treponema sp.]|nr:glutamate racemase [Treponema sp.]